MCLDRIATLLEPATARSCPCSSSLYPLLRIRTRGLWTCGLPQRDPVGRFTILVCIVGPTPRCLSPARTLIKPCVGNVQMRQTGLMDKTRTKNLSIRKDRVLSLALTYRSGGTRSLFVFIRFHTTYPRQVPLKYRRIVIAQCGWSLARS